MYYYLRIANLITLLLVISAINVYASPKASFTADHTGGCNPLVVTFTNTSTGATSFYWDFGNSSTTTSTSTSTTESTSYTTATTYTAILVAKNGSATDTARITITVYDTPVVHFTADTIGCVGTSLHFYDGSTLSTAGTGSYSWNFGNGDTSTAQNPTYSYGATGPYTITLKVTNSKGCSSFLKKINYVNIYSNPTAGFTADSTVICGPTGGTNFTSTSSGASSYTWYFGDGSSPSTLTNPHHTYSGYGSYDVKLVVKNTAGCKDSVTQKSYINVTSMSIAKTISPKSVCKGATITFTNHTTPSFLSTKWRFGNGDTATGSPSYYAYSASGTYYVTMITTNGACTDSLKDTITVNPSPSVSFSDTPSMSSCPAPANISFTDLTTGGGSPVWDFGDLTSGSTASSPTHTYYSNNRFYVKLIETNSYGCTDSLTKIVTIYPLNLGIQGNGHGSSVGGCLPDTVHFSYNAYYDYPIATFTTAYPFAVTSTSWSFGDGSPGSSSINPTHIYTSVGTYKVTLTITTSNGCSKSDTFYVHVGTPPTVKFSAPTSVCVHENIQFADSTIGATDYSWDFGDGSGAVDSSPVKNYSSPGRYTIKLIAFNNGCPDSLTKINYITVDSPKAAFGFGYSCTSYGQITFTNASLGATSYYWDFGDATTPSTAANPVHTYTSTGTFIVTFVASNSRSGCKDTLIKSILITNPTAKLNLSDTTVCTNQLITFSATLVGASAGRYQFRFDTAPFFSDTSSTMQFSFASTGIHSVKAYILDPRGCYDTASFYHITVAHPIAKFGASPKNGCAPDYVVFSDSSTDISGVSISKRTWDYGFGTTTTLSTATTSYTYTASGSYYVFLKVTDNVGCSDSADYLGYINVSKPVAGFSASPTTVCQGVPTNFYNSSTSGSVYTSNWSFGDGGTSTNNNPIHSYAGLGTYTVKLAVKDTLGCMDSVTKPGYITVVARPKANFTVDDSFKICAPMIVNFTDHTTGGVAYSWDFGDPLAHTGFGPTTSWTYTTPGVYNVREVVTNSNGCNDTAYKTVVLLGYSGLLNYSPLTGCAPLTVNFVAPVTGVVPVFIFDFGDGTTLKTTSNKASHTYTKVGPIVPKVILTNDTDCSATSIGLDTIHVDGVFAGYLYLPFPACDSGTFELIDTSYGSYSSIVSRSWTFNDGSTSTLINPYHTYHAPGSYPITLIDVTSSGCVDTLVRNFVVYTSPVINAGPDTTICVGDGAILRPSGGISYVWTPPATLSCSSCTNPVARPTSSTLYHVTGTDANGCKNIDTVSVFTKTKTTSVIDTGGQICQGSSIQLKDSSSAYATYTWIPATGLDDSHSYKPLASPGTTTTYMAIAREGSCIPDTQTVTVIVHPKPVISAGQDQTIVAGSSAQLSATGTYITHYLWHPAATLSCDSCYDPLATPLMTTRYTVDVASDYGCTDSSHVTVYVVCDHSQVFMPNSFTPNGDGINDRFYPRGKGLRIIKSFRIYDRWGQLIFQQQDMNINDKSAGWDGTFKGTVLTPDVFVYVVDAICDTGEPITWKGDISLIR